jgi:hypothetical protein
MQTIDQLVAFLDVDTDTLAAADLLSDLLAPRLDEIIDNFYDRVRRYDINVLVSDDVIPRLKEKQKQHWMALFGTGFGADYCAGTRRIAIRHRDIGLDPAWYIAGYTHVKLALIEVIIRSDFAPAAKGRLVKALEKYLAIDMALALSAYDVVVLT